MIGRGKVDSVLKYNAVGFDLNHTFVRYNMPAFALHMYESVCVFLVNHKKYPQEIFPPEGNEKQSLSFFFRAVFDQKTGFLLKIGSTMGILRAYYGYDRVSNQELIKVYGDPPVLQGYTIVTPKTDTFKNMHDYENASLVPLLARLVDLRKKGDLFLLNKSYDDFVNDIEQAFQHNKEIKDKSVFKTGKFPGYHLPKFLSQPRTFTQSVSKEFLKRLLELKNRGIFTFLATSKFYEVGNIILNSAVGEDWHIYFSFVVFQAKKPAFFDMIKKDPPSFTTLDGKQIDFGEFIKSNPQEKEKKVLLGGHASHIAKYLFTQVSKNYQAAYFGDSLATDCTLVYEKALAKNWDVILIFDELQELEQGFKDEEYMMYHQVWGSAIADKNITAGGIEKTTFFDFADSEAQRSFSKLNSYDCLEFFQI